MLSHKNICIKILSKNFKNNNNHIETIWIENYNDIIFTFPLSISNIKYLKFLKVDGFIIPSQFFSSTLKKLKYLKRIAFVFCNIDKKDDKIIERIIKESLIFPKKIKEITISYSYGFNYICNNLGM